jgi:predicted Zn-dependent protease
LAALNAPAQPAKAATAEELEQMHAKEPGNAAVAAQLGQKYVEANEFAKAEPLVKQVVTSNPNDASANYRYGWLLMRLQRPHAAEQYLIRTLQLDPKLTDAYGDLAIAAADNQDYVLSLKVLDTRAKYLPENAGTYFLRATNLDHLQQVKPAAIMYRKYLAVAKGESPDNEWRAKHRIIALDPKNETKGKENN